MNILKFIMLATVAFTGAARASENVNVPAIQINVTSSDGNPVSNAFVTLELWADSWGFYTGNGEPLPTHLGWHSTMKFHNSIAANSSSFVVPAFSGSYRNPNYMVRVEGLAVESCKDKNGSNYASGWINPETGFGIRTPDDCQWSLAENTSPVINCKLPLTTEQLQQMFQKWDEVCSRNQK